MEIHPFGESLQALHKENHQTRMQIFGNTEQRQMVAADNLPAT
jgi:hypothetical protein